MLSALDFVPLPSSSSVAKVAIVAFSVDQQPSKAEIAISKGWVQGVALVMIFGFLIMGVLAFRP